MFFVAIKSGMMRGLCVSVNEKAHVGESLKLALSMNQTCCYFKLDGVTLFFLPAMFCF